MYATVAVQWSQAQIDAAAGRFSEQGSDANYTHLRPSYPKDFVASTEVFWAANGEHADCPLRHQCDAKVVSLAATEASKRVEWRISAVRKMVEPRSIILVSQGNPRRL